MEAREIMGFMSKAKRPGMKECCPGIDGTGGAGADGGATS